MTISTYATLLNAKVIIPSQRTNYYAVQKDHFFDFLRPLIAGILFDEAWYLAAYPDIAEAIAAGVIPSAHEHYLQSGYFEHRLPYDIEVHSDWYVAQYDDVRAAVAAGTFTNGRDHFLQSGFREGRLPHPGFALKTTAA